MFNQLNRNEKNLAWTAIALCSLYLFSSFVIGPGFNRLNTLREQMFSRAVLLTKYKRVVQYSEQIRNLYGRYSGALKAGGSIQEEVSKFLQEVDQIGQRSGAHIVDMKPLNSSGDLNFSKIRIEIEVDAEQTTLGKFLFELKNSQAMIHVDNIRVSANARGESLKCHFILSRIAT
jgi:Tfp pilus assembly protein PilO